jgi:FkbM family methyltransferase
MAYGRHAGVSGYRLPWFRVVAIAALVVFVVLSLSRLSVFKRESIPLFSKKLDTLYNKVKNEWAESPKMPAMPGIENLSERIRVCTEKFGDPKFQVVTVPASAAHPSFHMAVYKEEDIVSNNIANVGTWEPAEVSEMFLTYSSPKSMEGKLFVDIGANVGWFSLIALAKGYEVLALEPAPANIQLIKFSMCLNPGFSDRFTFFENGLSEDTKTCYVISDDQNIGDGTTACDEESKYRMLNSTNPKYRVRSQAQFLRLDDVYYNRLPQPARPIGLLKIDIEGHEVHAFAKAGAGRLFFRFFSSATCHIFGTVPLPGQQL